MEYTEPKRKLLMSLARQEQYQTEDGKPNANILAAMSGLTLKTTKWLLDGQPSLVKPSASDKREPK